MTLIEICMHLIHCNPGHIFGFLTGSQRIGHRRLAQLFSHSLFFQRSMILETCTSASDGC